MSDTGTGTPMNKLENHQLISIRNRSGIQKHPSLNAAVDIPAQQSFDSVQTVMQPTRYPSKTSYAAPVRPGTGNFSTAPASEEFFALLSHCKLLDDLAKCHAFVHHILERRFVVRYCSSKGSYHSSTRIRPLSIAFTHLSFNQFNSIRYPSVASVIPRWFVNYKCCKNTQ